MCRKMVLSAACFALLAVGNAATAETRTAKADAAAVSPLQGSHWELVKFTGGDDTVLTPTLPVRYSLTFGPGNQVAAQIDCNRGRGTYETTAPAALKFGPMASTMAMCPPGPLSNRLPRDYSDITSYVLKEDQLFLSLKADAGIYEFRRATNPADKKAAQPSRSGKVESEPR